MSCSKLMCVAVRLHLLCSPLSGASLSSPEPPKSHTYCCCSKLQTITASCSKLMCVAVRLQLLYSLYVALLFRTPQTYHVIYVLLLQCVTVNYSELQQVDVCCSATATPLQPLYSAPLSPPKHPMSHVCRCAVRCSELQ